MTGRDSFSRSVVIGRGVMVLNFKKILIICSQFYTHRTSHGGFRQCCASCRRNGFYPCCSLEAASTSRQTEKEMTASDAAALAILPQGVPCIDPEKPCSDCQRTRFPVLFLCSIAKGFFPSACVSVQTCAHICAVSGTDSSCVGGHVCSHGRNFLQLPCHVLQDEAALLVVCC